MSFFSPLFSSFRLKFYETTEASKNSPIIRSPIFLPYSPRILNFEIRKSGDDFFWNYHRHGHRFAKKKTDVQNSHPPGRHFSSVSSSPFSKFEQYDKNVEKIPLLGTIVVPTIFEIISLFSLFFLFSFFRKSVAVSAIIPKKIIAAFIPLRKYECHSRATRRSKRTFPPPNLPFEAWQARRVHNLNFSRELPAKS